MTSGGTLSIPATNDWTSAGVLALKEARLPAHTRVLVTTVHVIGATGLLDTEAVLAAVEGRTLARVTALGDAAASITQLVVQTVSGGLTGWRTYSKAAQHSTGTLLLAGAQLELGTAQGGLASEAWQTHAPGHVVPGPAVGVLAAHVGEAAHVHTLVTDTRPLSWTVIVGQTLQLDTADLGIAAGPWRTGTHGSVVGRSTDRVCSTGSGDITGVLTFTIVAGGCPRTIAVCQTLVRGSASSKLIRNCSWRTLTLVSSNGVDTDSSWFTRTVLTFINIHTSVVGEDVSWLTPAAGNMVLC